MCGISGYLDLKKGVNRETLVNMNDIIAYRGPDDEGFCFFDSVGGKYAKGRDSANDLDEMDVKDIDGKKYFLAFGHRRLSILDLTNKGHQPMEKHNRVITYNGEIYNYQELKNELCSNGYTFKSNCDSEVLLSAYDFWGKECVNKFNGMWAFALYDIEKKELFISRDRFGVKPLYYYFKDDKLIFASEIKQILCDESVPRIVNDEVMAHHLRYNFRDYSEHTFFQGINMLRGGHNMLLCLDDGCARVKEMHIIQYYDISKKIVKDSYDSNLIGDELRKAINLRMCSDVKVGSCLSGGLDSSSIVGIICDEYRKQEKNEKLTTVSIGFPEDKNINELNFVESVVDYCKCEKNVITPDVLQVVRNLESNIWHQDEPLPHIGNEVTHAVFRGAKKCGCTVVFDGQGGDEGLAGYYTYYSNYLWNVLKKEGICQFCSKLKSIVNASSLTYKTAILYILYFNVPFIRKIGTKKRNRYLSKYAVKSINNNSINHFFKQKDELERQVDDFLYGTLPGILHRIDRSSMAYSVETRLPFLDYNYVEKVLSVKITDKLKDGFTKAPLREYVQDILPEDVVWRKNKLGFPAPSDRWLWEIPTDYVLNLLDNPRSKRYFNIKKIKKDYLRQYGDEEMIGKFIIVELWMRKFNIA